MISLLQIASPRSQSHPTLSTLKTGRQLARRWRDSLAQTVVLPPARPFPPIAHVSGRPAVWLWYCLSVDQHLCLFPLLSWEGRHPLSASVRWSAFSFFSQETCENTWNMWPHSFSQGCLSGAGCCLGREGLFGSGLRVVGG